MENFIPGIEKKIENLLKKLNLTPQVPPDVFISQTEGKKHRYFSLCNDGRGRKVIFYARLHNNPDARQKMVREISFLNEIKRKSLVISRYLPHVYSWKREKDWEWFLREYFPVSPLGTNEQLNQEITPKDTALLAQSASDIKNTLLSELEGVPLARFDTGDYLSLEDFIPRLLERGIMAEKEAGAIVSFFKANKSLLEKENRYFTHGDFNLGNLIVSGGNLKIIDWESIQINNQAADMAYLFTHLWQASQLVRKDLIENYLRLLSERERDAFKKLFLMVVFDLAADGFEAQPKEIKSSLLKKRKEFFEKLFLGPILGFEKLIKI